MYEINVFLRDKHLFTTYDKCLIQDDETIKEIYWKIKQVLTESKGYTILIKKWELVEVFDFEVY